MTQRIEPSIEKIWLKELNPSFFNMTLRIEPFFEKSMSQRIQPSWHESKNWTIKKKTIQRLELLLFKKNSKNWTLFWTCLKELNLFKKRLKDLNPFCSKKKTQRIEPFFWTWLKELNLFVFWKRIEPSLWYERETQSVAPAALSVNLSKLRVPFDERSSSLIH